MQYIVKICCLVVAALDLNRQQRLLNLAADAAIGAVEKQSAGQLHGQRAGAFGDATRKNVPPRRVHHAWQIDAPMLDEVLILGGGNGVFEDRGNLLPGEQDSALQRETSDHSARRPHTVR